MNERWQSMIITRHLDIYLRTQNRNWLHLSNLSALEACIAIWNWFIIWSFKGLPFKSSNATYHCVLARVCILYICACACMQVFLLEGSRNRVFSKTVVKWHLRHLLVETTELYNFENDFKVSRTLFSGIIELQRTI